MLNLGKSLRKERCKTFLAAEKLQPAIFAHGNNPEDVEVSNLACSNSNQSINFVSMDSGLYYVFAERLGIDLSQKKDKSAVVILNERVSIKINIYLYYKHFSNCTRCPTFEQYHWDIRSGKRYRDTASVKLVQSCACQGLVRCR